MNKLQSQRAKLTEIDTHRPNTLSVLKSDTINRPSHSHTLSKNQLFSFSSQPNHSDISVPKTPLTLDRIIHESDFKKGSVTKASHQWPMSDRKSESGQSPRFSQHMEASKVLHSSRRLMALESELNDLLVKAKKR